MNVTLFQLAYQLAKAGRKAEARRLLEHVLRIDSTNEQAWLLYADCLDAWADRVQALEACVRLNPNAWSAMANLAALQRTRLLEEDPNGLFPQNGAAVAPDAEFHMPAFLSQPEQDDLPPGLVTGSLEGKLAAVADRGESAAPAVEGSERPNDGESLPDTAPLRLSKDRLPAVEETLPPAGVPFTPGDAGLPDLRFSTGLQEAGERSAADGPAAGGDPQADGLAQRLDWLPAEPADLSGDDPLPPRDPSWAEVVWQRADEPEVENELLQAEPGLPVTGMLAADAEVAGALWWTGEAARQHLQVGADERQPTGRPRPGSGGPVPEEGDPWMRMVRDSLTESEADGRPAQARRGPKRARAQTGAARGSDPSIRSLLIALIILVTFMLVTVLVLIGALLARGL